MKKTPSLLEDSLLHFSDAQNLSADDDESVLSTTTFEFDNIIVNSRVYRETMRKYQMASRPKQGLETQQPALVLKGNAPSLTGLDTYPQLGTRAGIPSSAENSKSDDRPIEQPSVELHRAFSFESIGTVKPDGKLSLPTNVPTITQASATPIEDNNVMLEDFTCRVNPVSPSSQSDAGKETQGNVGSQKSKPLPMPPPVNKSTDPSMKYCGKCGLRLIGEFVRALDDKFHLECFTCIVSSLGLHVLFR